VENFLPVTIIDKQIALAHAFSLIKFIKKYNMKYIYSELKPQKYSATIALIN